jgi:hypothetical protein
VNRAPATTAAFNELIAALTEIRDGYALNEDRFTDPIEVAEAYRYVLQMLSAASELFAEADPSHPRFASIVSPARKLQGDNPDGIYHFARISGDRSYRITGNVGRTCYTSFTLHGVAADGGMAGPLLGDRNDRSLAIAADGSYELVLSAEPHDGNWMALDHAVHSVVVRSYFDLEPSAQNDAAISVDIDIRPLDDGDPPPPLDDATFADRLAEAVRFLRQCTLGQNVFGSPSGVPFVSEVANELPVPFSFRDSGLPVPGAADIWYSMGRWSLGPDEALVMTGRLPEAAFTNVMLWNAHMQTLEYRYRRSSINQTQLHLDDDGSFRIVVAHRDPGPGHPNWLDTDGHERGSIFWRFLLPEENPGPIATEVITLD